MDRPVRLEGIVRFGEGGGGGVGAEDLSGSRWTVWRTLLTPADSSSPTEPPRVPDLLVCRKTTHPARRPRPPTHSAAPCHCHPPHRATRIPASTVRRPESVGDPPGRWEREPEGGLRTEEGEARRRRAYLRRRREVFGASPRGVGLGPDSVGGGTASHRWGIWERSPARPRR
jgi:hypothetical protein